MAAPLGRLLQSRAYFRLSGARISSTVWAGDSLVTGFSSAICSVRLSRSDSTSAFFFSLRICSLIFASRLSSVWYSRSAAVQVLELGLDHFDLDPQFLLLLDHGIELLLEDSLIRSRLDRAFSMLSRVCFLRT